MRVTCLVAAPDVRCVETGRGTWLYWGTPAGGLDHALESARTAEGVVRRVSDVASDAAVVRLGADGSVDAFRSVTGTYNLYTLETGDRFVVTDNFRNALAEVDVAARTLSDTAVTDHLLFRHPPEPDTYVSEIRALEHGTWLHRDPDGTRSVDVVDRFDARSGSVEEDPVTALDERLNRLLRDRTGVRNMFSGGVDSTLVQTYLGDERPVHMGIDSPEFDYELEYAARAQGLLGVEAETVTHSEDDFLELLERSVETLGSPSHFHQTVLTNATFGRIDPTTFVNAAGADSVYGLNGVKSARFASWLAPLFSVPGAARAWKFGPGRVSASGMLPDYASWLRRHPADPESFAQRLPFFTDPEVVARISSPETVERRYARNLAYVSRRVLRDGRNRGFPGQVELAHLLSFFRHNGVQQWRQLGHAHGHGLFVPFKTRRVVDGALSVPAERRYIEGRSAIRSLRSKYVPKELLERRLPGYPASQEKGAGSLPVERYFESGSLADAFDRYDPPSFVPASLRAGHVESFGPVTWNLLTWAIWRDRVLRNPDLDRVDGTSAYAA